MPAWIKNVSLTWDQINGWKTDMPRTALRGGFYTTAEYHLQDGIVLQIPMDQMQAALEDVPTRSDMMVGPFLIHPHQKKINGHGVPMKIIPRAKKYGPYVPPPEANA